TRLVLELFPELSSLANRVSAPRLDPVNTPTTVSKLDPIVSMNEEGCVTVNVQGAVQVHHALGVAPLPEIRSSGSTSEVNPKLNPVAVMLFPESVIRLAKLSFVSTMPDAVNDNGFPANTPVA